jgi:hypothetical protein
LQRFLYLLVTLHILDSMPHHSFDEIQSPARAQELSVHRFDGWLAINRNSTDSPRIASSLGSWSANRKLEGSLVNFLWPVILSEGTMAFQNHERHLPTPATSDILLPISVREPQHLCGDSYLNSALSL